MQHPENLGISNNASEGNPSMDLLKHQLQEGSNNNTRQLLHPTETRISKGDTGMQLKYD